jgi:hypothetical protein
MKYKTTAKAVKNGYKAIIKIGYCDAQYLLKARSPVAYGCGTYGWNFDVYEVNGVAVVTGYRPVAGIEFDYNELREIEKKAQNATSEEADAMLVDLVARLTK